MRLLTQRELKDAQLRLLDVFVAQCEEDGLDYFLYYGSLIGAVRHKGMIPWDDDIDFAMPRASYDKLKNVPWETHDCELISPGTSSQTPYLMAKLADRRTILLDEIGSALSSVGANIDIFPLDNTGHPGVRSHLISHLLRALKAAQILKTVRISPNRSLAKNTLLAIGKTILLPLSANRIVRLADYWAQKGGQNGLLVSLLGPYGQREFVKPDWVEKSVKLEFETRMVSAPAGFHEVLTRLYGDYMKLPPTDKQVSHHSFKVYER